MEILLADCFDTVVSLAKPTIDFARWARIVDMTMEDLTPARKNGTGFQQLCEQALATPGPHTLKISPFPSAARGLERFAKAGYQIHLVTAATSEDFKLRGLPFLNGIEHLIKEVHFQSMQLTEEVRRSEPQRIASERRDLALKIGATVGFDDSYTNAREMSNIPSLRMFLLNRPWNRNNLRVHGIRRCRSVTEAYRILHGTPDDEITSHQQPQNTSIYEQSQKLALAV